MWKPIKDFEKEYEISDKGEIHTLYNKRGYITPKLTNHGIMTVQLWKNGQYYSRSFARLILETFTGKTGKYAVHKDGNPCNNRLENLAWSEKKPPSFAIKICCRELNKLFKSIREVVKETGLTKTEVLYSCNSGKSVNGLTFFYVSKPSKDKLYVRKVVENLPDEQWKDLEGGNGRFKISNKGRIKSLNKLTKSKDGKSFHINEKIVQQRLVDGRATIQVYVGDGKRKFFTVPNEVFKHFILKDNLKRVRHIDQNPLNNATDNLYIEG